MDFPYAIEGGSTIKFFWVLNKLYMAKQEAILNVFQQILPQKQMHFLFGLNMELQGGLKVGGSEINFVI